MMLRNALLGLGTVLTLAGVAAAEPPVNPLVEGREPNQVVREFYETEPPTFGYGSGPVEFEPARGMESEEGLWAIGVMWDLALNEFTMPLGTVPMWD